jgi:aconitate hydratase
MNAKNGAFKKSLKVENRNYTYFSLKQFAAARGVSHDKLPKTIIVLLENLLRNQDGSKAAEQQLDNILNWRVGEDIVYRPVRVLMQDLTGVPAIVDLAAMRDTVFAAGGDPAGINPRIPVDLIIDHSVMVDRYASADAYRLNVAAEMERNSERYTFLRWGQKSFDNFRVVPPGTGICHQVNLEYLARTIWTQEKDGETLAYPDTLVGTDSHTTMINGLGVLGWGVGGIEAEAAMLGQPISMLVPEVVGFRLGGALCEGVTATDLVLSVTERLRAHGVVGKFVEFFGPGLDQLPLADRATIANMAPEYGATCGFFPVDRITLEYLLLTGRDPRQIALVEAYCKAQGLWREPGDEPHYSQVLELDLALIVPSLAGPKRPQDRVAMPDMKQVLEDYVPTDKLEQRVEVGNFSLSAGDVVIAAITSCTNTSNPAVMMAAGLVAQKARALGLTSKPWVKTSLAPGSRVVSDYLAAAGLQPALDALGFQVVGYGCTTCIGNSGPLKAPIASAISDNDLWVSAVLSGNRNFEGRIHQQVKASWLASPPLVVAYALAGTTRIDLSCEPLGIDKDGQAVYLRDIWPSNAEVAEKVQLVNARMFQREYAEVFDGDAEWQGLPIPESQTYAWEEKSTYIRQPSYIGVPDSEENNSGFKAARILALLGDSITTDHISPAGAIKAESPAGRYLREHGVDEADFNSYGSRRGNHEVMLRGTFANIRLRNRMVPTREGGFTRYLPDGKEVSIFDAALKYAREKRPLVIIAGREYGTGSSRDWAAKGTLLLGVKAVIAESFERIHRSNLVGMGVLPLQFIDGCSTENLGLNGEELISLPFSGKFQPKMKLPLVIERPGGSKIEIELLCRIDTEDEVAYYKKAGILNYVLGRLI